MAHLDLNSMTQFLSKSISSINQNKINGMLAEIDLRRTLIQMGFSGRVSQGGWILRNQGAGVFGHHTIVLFPETITPNQNYSTNFSPPPSGLHTICATMHQIGVHSFYCVPNIAVNNDTNSVDWHTTQLGIPTPQPYTPLLGTIQGFTPRIRKHNFLTYKTNASGIPSSSLAEEFTKEHIRVVFRTRYLAEISDIDGIFWGQQYTYPIEIKEKTAATDKDLGEYFGLDAGPFVKLAFYAAKKGNLHSLFFVREIDNIQDRQLIQWWFITFDKLAQFASWVIRGGGTNMGGGRSSVVRIPKAEFTPLTTAALNNL